MAIADFELGLELDSAGESILEIFLILLGCTKQSHHYGMPHPIGAVKAGAVSLIRQPVIIFVGGFFFFFPGCGLGVDLAGPLTAVSSYYRRPRDGALQGTGGGTRRV